MYDVVVKCTICFNRVTPTSEVVALGGSGRDFLTARLKWRWYSETQRVSISTSCSPFLQSVLVSALGRNDSKSHPVEEKNINFNLATTTQRVQSPKFCYEHVSQSVPTLHTMYIYFHDKFKLQLILFTATGLITYW